jgi:hypothetical protein
LSGFFGFYIHLIKLTIEINKKGLRLTQAFLETNPNFIPLVNYQSLVE